MTNYHWHDNNITMVYFLPFLQAPFGDLLWMNSSPHPCLSLWRGSCGKKGWLWWACWIHPKHPNLHPPHSQKEMKAVVSCRTVMRMIYFYKQMTNIHIDKLQYTVVMLNWGDTAFKVHKCLIKYITMIALHYKSMSLWIITWQLHIIITKWHNIRQ